MLRNTLAFAVFAASLPAVASLPVMAQQPIRIKADLTEVARKLYHADIDIPVKPGALVLIVERATRPRIVSLEVPA